MPNTLPELKIPVTRLAAVKRSGIHLIARYPKALPAPVRPFEPLDLYSWLATGILCCIILLSIYGSRKLGASLEKSKFDERMWVLLSVLSFCWYNLYGIDLRTSLISQDFEKSIDTWDDLDFFSVQLASLISHGGNDYFHAPNLLEDMRLLSHRAKWGLNPDMNFHKDENQSIELMALAHNSLASNKYVFLGTK